MVTRYSHGHRSIASTPNAMVDQLSPRPSRPCQCVCHHGRQGILTATEALNISLTPWQTSNPHVTEALPVRLVLWPQIHLHLVWRPGRSAVLTATEALPIRLTPWQIRCPQDVLTSCVGRSDMMRHGPTYLMNYFAPLYWCLSYFLNTSIPLQLVSYNHIFLRLSVMQVYRYAIASYSLSSRWTGMISNHPWCIKLYFS